MKDDSTDMTSQLATILGSLALGAVAMYLADPEQGRRRRALAQDKVRSFTGRTGDRLGSSLGDAGNRLSGLQAQASRILGQRDYKPLDNHVLEARVRSKLGRFVSDAHRIVVEADQGSVTLRGGVHTDEHRHLMRMVEGIPGVDRVRDRLDQFDDEGRVINGPADTAGERGMTAAEMAALIGGGLLGYYGYVRRSPVAYALAAAGVGLAVRGVGGSSALARLAGVAGLGSLGSSLGSFGDRLGGVEWRSLFAMGGAAEPVRVQKSIEIKATPETVFDVWSRYENFPHFMSHVAEVRDLGQQRSHWVVKGPGGARYEWDSVLTESRRPALLAWRSEPGASVENSGSVRLEPAGNGVTRAIVTMSYTPPAGAIGQTLATLLGSDPGRELEDDLARMKQFIERGLPSQDMSTPTTTSGQVLH